MHACHCWSDSISYLLLSHSLKARINTVVSWTWWTHTVLECLAPWPKVQIDICAIDRCSVLNIATSLCNCKSQRGLISRYDRKVCKPVLHVHLASSSVNELCFFLPGSVQLEHRTSFAKDRRKSGANYTYYDRSDKCRLCFNVLLHLPET